MRPFWSDPYLWIHLSGLAAFPLFLVACLVGFAVGDPFLPTWLELLLIAIAGIAPILWMQWQRPFYIFSLVAVSVKPGALTDDQRRLLTLFKLPRNRVLAVLVSIALVMLLQKIYAIAPIAAPAASFLPNSRLLGLLLAAVTFLACNLFVQVPVSVASVMVANQSSFAATLPFPLETLQRNFTLIGLRLNRILPPVIPDAKPTLEPQALVNVRQTAGSDAIAMPHVSPIEPLTNDVWAEDSSPRIDPLVTDGSATQAVTTDSIEVNQPEQATTEAEGSSEPGASQ